MIGDLESTGDVLAKGRPYDVSSWRKTFRLEAYPEADLAADVERLMAGEKWLENQPEGFRRVYALAVKHAAMKGRPVVAAVPDGLEATDEEGVYRRKKSERRFRYTFEEFEKRCDHPRMRRLADIMRQIASGERKRGVFMWGAPGTYKTWLQMALMREAEDVYGIRAVVWPARQLVEDVQATYGSPHSGRREIFDLVLRNRIVCLDDLGHEKVSEDASSIIHAFIEEVYRRQDTLTLVVATNLKREAIPEHYEPHVLSRIKGMCDGFDIPISDTRGAGGAL